MRRFFRLVILSLVLAMAATIFVVPTNQAWAEFSYSALSGFGKWVNGTDKNSTYAQSGYLNATGEKSYIRGILFANTNSSAITVGGYLVPGTSTGRGTATEQYTVIPPQILAAYGMLFVPFDPPGLIMHGANCTFQGWCNATEKCTIAIFGGTETP